MTFSFELRQTGGTIAPADLVLPDNRRTRFGSLESEKIIIDRPRVPRTREIESLQVQTGYLTISLKKNCQ